MTVHANNRLSSHVTATPEVRATWQQMCGPLYDRYGETTYRRWLEPIKADMDVDTADVPRMTLTLPTRFMCDWVQAHYGDTIRDMWAQIEPTGQIVFAVMSPLAKAAQAKDAIDGAAPAQIQPLGYSERGYSDQGRTQPDRAPADRDPLRAVTTVPATPAPATLSSSFADGYAADLDPRFTFDNFVVGKPNELAYAAARRVAETDKPAFNPLFLYSGVGLGKTHLMHAIAWHIRTHYPSRRVIYMSAEKFMYQFVRALRFKDTVAFKEQFRSVDVLMIDDVQFICGKDTTQEEFFHTFNALVDRNRQVIISADKPPQDLDRMEERLRSRLGWGLVADLHPATYELRLGILHAKAEKLGCPVPDKVMEFLAHKICSNVRELEGALNRIVAHAQLVGRTISLEMTQEVLSDMLRSTERRITIDEIQKKVAEHYSVRVADMHSARRARAVARPRQVAMYLAKQLTPRSLPEIGRKFGGRDHTTVIHAVRKIEELSAYDAAFREDVDLLRRLLQN